MSSAVVTLAPALAPLQADVDSYLAYKRLRLTPQSERSYRGTLRELVRFYPTLTLEEFEPPKGTRLVEDFLVTRWGDRADDRIWQLLEQLDAPGHHYLMCRQTLRRRRPPQRKAFRDLAAALAQAAAATDGIADESCRFELAWAQSALSTAADWLDLAIDTASHQVIKQFPDEPMGHHGAHDWWYRCLVRAGIVAAGVTHGARMHGARHSAGQRVLEKTGNLKAAQSLLGHKNISTTGNHYVGWDDELDATMALVVPDAALDERLLRVASTASRERSRA